jgi:hypothetical protein
LIHYFLSPYVIRATYISLSHQFRLETYSVFARRQNLIVNVDDLRRVESDGYRFAANLKDDSNGKVFYIHPEIEGANTIWKILDAPRGGYKETSKKWYKAKIGDDMEARVFEEQVVPQESVGVKESKTGATA